MTPRDKHRSSERIIRVGLPAILDLAERMGFTVKELTKADLVVLAQIVFLSVALRGEA